MTPSLDLEKQARTLIASGRYYVDLFLKKQGAFLGVVIVLLLMTPRSALRQGSARPRWALVGIALAAFGMYALVYAEGRYLGPFVALLWGSLLSFVRVDASPVSRRALRLPSRVLVIFAALGIGALILDGMTRVVGWDAESWQPTLVVEQPKAAALRPVPFARALLELGLKPGDGIAYLGDSFDAFFARLARLRIIAEVPWDQLDEFWRAPPEQRAEVLRRLRDIGATALVAEQIPPGADRTGWKRVADSRHFLYYLE